MSPLFMSTTRPARVSSDTFLNRLLALEKRLEALERAVRELKAQRAVDANGNVTEHIGGNYTLKIDGSAILRSELYMAISSPEVHLNPNEFREGLPAEHPSRIATDDPEIL